ncbi:MAG TPA: hypothetical protein VF939_25170 [Puia sp.]
MLYPFDTSEQLIFDFEALLRIHGLNIRSGSDLERISFAVMETNAKHKKEIAHDDSSDIRDIFSDVAGLVDFVTQIVRNGDHEDFEKLIPHLQLLNTSSTTVLTSRSKVTDEGNNKLLELYTALLCMRLSSDVDLDDPNNSKGDNPDVIFTYNKVRWAIACKALHSNNEKTLYDTIVKGTEQINRSPAVKGIVLVNVKNIINREELWPIVNKDDLKTGETASFGAFNNLNTPTEKLRQYGEDFRTRMIGTVGLDSLIRLSESKKCPAGFLIFLHALTSVIHDDQPTATILKTFNLVSFSQIDQEYLNLARDLNDAMHLCI